MKPVTSFTAVKPTIFRATVSLYVSAVQHLCQLAQHSASPAATINRHLFLSSPLLCRALFCYTAVRVDYAVNVMLIFEGKEISTDSEGYLKETTGAEALQSLSPLPKVH